MSERPDRIDPGEVKYHVRVLEQMKATQAVMNSWSSYLVQTYQLGPQDHVTDDGRIVRAETPAE